MADLERSGLFTPYTSLFNVTGQPAISIPVGFGADGLPTDVQIVGKPLNEDRLLQVALQMEAAHPWAHQRPDARPQDVGDRGAGGRRAPRRPRVPRALSISTASICASSQVTQRRRARPASPRPAARRAGRPAAAAACAGGGRAAASTSRTNSRWVSVSGPASS